jgi:hypothetical protein
MAGTRKPRAGTRKPRAGRRKRTGAAPASPRVALPPPVALPRIAKGRRPQFYEDPAVDQLFAMVTALTGEISVLFDRLDTVQRLLDAAGVVAAQAVADYVPQGPAAAERAQHRDELLRRVFAVLEIAAAPQASPAS